MTGFARRELAGSWGTLTCELRSVNHRYLEPGFRLPEELRPLESDLRQLLAKHLKRGKVDCTMHLRGTQGGERELRVDATALGRVAAAVGQVLREIPGAAVDAVEVLRWPGVVETASPDTEALLVAGKSLFQQTLDELGAMRLREGKRLGELIEQRCAGLGGLVGQVRTRLPEIQARVRTRLNERVAELLAVVDRERIEQEVVMQLQRLDVAEELDRLTGHIEETRRIMGSGEAAGRRLDFLMQELNREANTLASKSQDLDTTRISVDMKVLIEQMREQVQNVE
ncbi:MAG TPA: YicC/YloC family endoribonuclease, partial [Steroidobacteraceae bacterium]|nr:YicC/YloC family endoribonuclease [Steroidobacteraceae bacterium]HEX5162513.1 YicC/YloC family endoribonuclease [Steroidobacteraceae bacterium]